MLRTIFFLIAFGAVAFFCEKQTKGFRFSEILTSLPNRPDWEVAPLSVQEEEVVRGRLAQSFHYLGAGEQCVAFLGEDGKTVLKFIRHGHWWTRALNGLPLPASWAAKRSEMKCARLFHPDYLFRSCTIAHESLKEESGLLYLHLNKTQHRWGTAVLYDPIGVMQRIDLDKTEFVVQEYGRLAFDVIDTEMQQGRPEEAMACIRALLVSIEAYSRKGIHIDNPAIQRNIGFREKRVLLLDIGSFQQSDQFKSKKACEEEVSAVTKRLERWIRKKHPVLLPKFYEERSILLGG